MKLRAFTAVAGGTSSDLVAGPAPTSKLAHPCPICGARAWARCQRLNWSPASGSSRYAVRPHPQRGQQL